MRKSTLHHVQTTDKSTAYCSYIGLTAAQKLETGISVQGIGGMGVSIGTFVIENLVRDLQVIIDVAFLFITEDVPSVLSMK